MPNLVVTEYTQSIAYERDGAPQERLSISVRFTYEAASSGWVRKNFCGRGGPTAVERQAPAVYRSRNVDLIGWYERLHDMYRKMAPQATTDRSHFAGRGAPAPGALFQGRDGGACQRSMYGKGDDVANRRLDAIEDLSLPWGLTMFEAETYRHFLLRQR